MKQQMTTDDWTQAVRTEALHIENKGDQHLWQRSSRLIITAFTLRHWIKLALFPLFLVLLMAARDVLSYNHVFDLAKSNLVLVLVSLPTFWLAVVGGFFSGWVTQQPMITAFMFGLYVPLAWLVTMMGSAQQFHVGFSDDLAVAAQMCAFGFLGAALAYVTGTWSAPQKLDGVK